MGDGMEKGQSLADYLEKHAVEIDINKMTKKPACYEMEKQQTESGDKA